jgi:DNA-binding PucR family transcriptional regulator
LYAILSAASETEREHYPEAAIGSLLRLPPAQRQPLLETLITLHEKSDSLRAAAGSLHVHPKTVQYRIRRIQELTWYCWGRPCDRLRLDIAMHLLRIAVGTGEGADGSWYQVSSRATQSSFPGHPS